MNTVYFFGDSIGQGIIADDQGNYHISRQNWTAQFPADEYQIENYSSLGFTVEKGLKRLNAKTPEPGHLCLIEFGGNDSDLDWKEVAAAPAEYHRARLEPEEFTETLEAFVTEVRSRGLTPVLLTPVPLLTERYFAWVTKKNDPSAVLAYLKDKEHMNRQQESYANMVRYTAQNMNCMLIDVRQAFLREPDLPSLICCDGIHLNEAGQTLFGRILLDALRLLPESRP